MFKSSYLSCNKPFDLFLFYPNYPFAKNEKRTNYYNLVAKLDSATSNSFARLVTQLYLREGKSILIKGVYPTDEL